MNQTARKAIFDLREEAREKLDLLAKASEVYTDEARQRAIQWKTEQYTTIERATTELLNCQTGMHIGLTIDGEDYTF